MSDKVRGDILVVSAPPTPYSLPSIGSSITTKLWGLAARHPLLAAAAVGASIGIVLDNTFGISDAIAGDPVERMRLRAEWSALDIQRTKVFAREIQLMHENPARFYREHGLYEQAALYEKFPVIGGAVAAGELVDVAHMPPLGPGAGREPSSLIGLAWAISLGAIGVWNDADGGSESGEARTVTTHADVSTPVNPGGDPPEDPDDDLLCKDCRTWKKIKQDIREWWRGDNRWVKFKDWVRGLFRGKPKPEDKIMEVEGFWNKFRYAIREWGRGQVDHWGNKIATARNVVRHILKNPAGEFVDMLNKPVKLWRAATTVVNDGYGTLRLESALYRRATGSRDTHPIGSGLFDEKYEWMIGAVGTAQIGAMWQHYVLGWNYRSAFINSLIWAGGEALTQHQTGGAGSKDFDWVRQDLAAFSSLVWGFPIVFYRIGNGMFPARTWEALLESRAESGSLWSRILRGVPGWLAPRKWPSWKNVTFYILTNNAYRNAINGWVAALAEDADMGEFYAAFNARMWTTNLLVDWYSAAWNPYQRWFHSGVHSAATIAQIAYFTEHFQLYKGRQFYREVLRRLQIDKVSIQEAFETMRRALGAKNFVFLFNVFRELGLVSGEKPDSEFYPEECWDFFDDINKGQYFTPADILYFNELTRIELGEDANKYSRRSQLMLIAVLASYAEASVPPEWANGRYGVEEEQEYRDEEVSLRELVRRHLTERYGGHMENLAAPTRNSFMRLVERINRGDFDDWHAMQGVE